MSADDETHPVGGFRAAVTEIVHTVIPPFILAMAATIAVASAIGLLLTHVLNDSGLVHWEERLVESLEANRTPRLTSLTGAGTFIADPIPVAVLWGLSVVVVSITTRRWRPAMFIMVAVGGEKLSYLVSTLIVRRPRPEVTTVGTVHVTSSFPSGHVGSAVSLYGSLTLLVLVLLAGRLRPQFIWITAIVASIFAVVVGYSRLYRGHHFLTDVIVGCAIGSTWVAVSYRLVLRPYLEGRDARTHRRLTKRSR